MLVMAHLISSSNGIDFSYSHEWEHKSTSLSEIQVLNQQNTISVEEKLDVITQLGNGE
jgi:hypothetical protein